MTRAVVFVLPPLAWKPRTVQWAVVLIVLVALPAIAASERAPDAERCEEPRCEQRPLDICGAKETCREGTFVPVPPAQLDWEATVLHSVRVRYPSAVAAHPPGEVGLRVYVSRDGRTARVDVTKSLHPAIDAAVVDAVARYRWSPAFSRGAPVDTIVEHRVRFRPWGRDRPESGLVRISRSCCVCGL